MGAVSGAFTPSLAKGQCFRSHTEKSESPTTPGHCPQRKNPATAEKASHYTSDNFKKGSALNTGRKGEMEEGRQEACP